MKNLPDNYQNYVLGCKNSYILPSLLSAMLGLLVYIYIYPFKGVYMDSCLPVCSKASPFVMLGCPGARFCLALWHHSRRVGTGNGLRVSFKIPYSFTKILIYVYYNPYKKQKLINQSYDNSDIQRNFR